MTIHKEDLFNKLQLHVTCNEPLTNAHHILSDYETSGGKQDAARRIAEKLQINHNADEGVENRILEILDMIEGWCRPEWTIWK